MGSPDAYTQEKALYNLFRLRQSTGDYRGAAQIADTLLQFKERQQREWQQNNIYEIQSSYDKAESERQIKQYKLYFGALFLVFVLSVLVLMLYHKYKVTRARRTLLEKHLLLNECNGRLDENVLSQHEAHKEQTSLRQRVDNMKDKEVQTLSNGKLLYESIVQNHNTIHWSGQDFLDFLAYFKFIDPDYVAQLDQLYSNLSPRQYLFLIATGRMNKSETEVGDILAISPGSVRSIKSRIKTRRLVSSKEGSSKE